MSDSTAAQAASAGAAPAVDSPPPSAQPSRMTADPRGRLHELARQLVHTQNRRLLCEFLTLRRATR